jgi:hypothetical protein
MNQAAKNLLTILLIVAAVVVAKRGPLLTPTSSPIPEPGLHVLILEETATRTAELGAVINGKWRELVPSGNLRVLDAIDEFGQRYDFSKIEPKWKRALETWPGELPWLVVSNAPHGGESKPLVAGELIPTIEKWSQAGK